jgi:hypothetical protein
LRRLYSSIESLFPVVKNQLDKERWREDSAGNLGGIPFHSSGNGSIQELVSHAEIIRAGLSIKLYNEEYHCVLRQIERERLSSGSSLL